MSSTPTTPPFRNSDLAPFIYFDVAPTFGTMGGAIQIELGSRTLTPGSDNDVSIEFITTGRLRCSPAAAKHLRDAIDRSLEMLEQQHESPAASTTGTLN